MTLEENVRRVLARVTHLRMKLGMREEIKGRYDLSYEQREDEAWVIRIKRK